MRRVPGGYVSKEAKEAVEASLRQAGYDPNASTQDLVAEFERDHQRRGCYVCQSDHLELIDELLRRGAASGAVSLFLSKRLNLVIGDSTIRRHRRMHIDE
jgi:5'-deoxynucleotidase YfbR-like HD superfamily hydrolase